VSTDRAAAQSPQPRVSFTAIRLDDTGSPTFEVSPGVGGLRLRGGLSAGSTGWTLTARARRYRRTLTVHVTARLLAPESSAAGVEDHHYELVLADLAPVRYRLRVNHVFLLPGDPAPSTLLPVFECSVNLGSR
jgi:hypothetical protein